MKNQFIIILTGFLFIVSCGKTTDPEFVCGDTITDIDGNTYHTVNIGSQCWTVENLKATKYNDGSTIPTGLSDAEWSADTLGAFAIYNNDAANNVTYGKLYNWYAVKTGKLAIEGWHIPDTSEVSTLRNFTGGFFSGGKLKSVSSLWGLGNVGATNSTGYSALPSGMRQQAGGYASKGVEGVWWTTTEITNHLTAGAFRVLGADSTFQMIGSIQNRGYAIRLIKN
ncbi:MAG TPA: fibrobacter succinogenes major paralogous domain-containing protein [Chitinophagales bacterium]|nr:fibrobacter succinogenes major paralogous domain-containing protein [Chitinophagales bacterium]